VRESPLALALLHQAGAMIVLTIAVAHAERIAPRARRLATPEFPVAERLQPSR
jgi:heme A synthase